MPAQAFDDEYKDGVLLKRTARTVSDAELRWQAAQARLIAGRGQLRQIRTQAQAAADASATLTLVQLTNQFRTLCGAVATLTQTLMDIELMIAWQQDDGAD